MRRSPAHSWRSRAIVTRARRAPTIFTAATQRSVLRRARSPTSRPTASRRHSPFARLFRTGPVAKPLKRDPTASPQPPRPTRPERPTEPRTAPAPTTINPEMRRDRSATRLATGRPRHRGWAEVLRDARESMTPRRTTSQMSCRSPHEVADSLVRSRTELPISLRPVSHQIAASTSRALRLTPCRRPWSWYRPGVNPLTVSPHLADGLAKTTRALGSPRTPDGMTKPRIDPHALARGVQLGPRSAGQRRRGSASRAARPIRRSRPGWACPGYRCPR